MKVARVQLSALTIASSLHLSVGEPQNHVLPTALAKHVPQTTTMMNNPKEAGACVR